MNTDKIKKAGAVTRILFSLITILLLLPGVSRAEEAGIDGALQGFPEEQSAGSALENALEGFDVQAPEQAVIATAPPAPSMFDLTGSFTLSAVSNVHQHQSSTGTDYSGLSRLRFTLDLGVDARFSRTWDATIRGRGFHDAAYGIQGREDYTHEALDSLANEAELREAFVRGKVLPSLDVKVGRQIVVWGKSDNLRVTDVLNPLDNREPGMVDIEDLRIPLSMGRVDWYTGRWSVSAIAIPEIRFNKNPPFGGDFYPSTMPPPREVIPGDGGDNTEYAFALNGILTGWDLSFYAARLFNDQPSARVPSSFPFPPIELAHDRISMQGAALNAAAGNWLFKTEAARFTGLRFSTLPDRLFDRIDALLGVEYTGFTDTTVSLEAVHRRLMDFDAVLEAAPDQAQEDQVQAALRFQRDFLHDRLQLTLLALRGGWSGRDGAMQRISLKYALTDSLAVTGGFMNYGAGEKQEVRNIGKNDRVFCEAKYSF